MTAARAITRACSARRTNSRSTFPRFCREARVASYEHWSWPGFLARAFKGRRVAVAAGTASRRWCVLALSLLLVPGESLLAAHLGPGAFYEVVPYAAMVAAALVLSLYGMAVWARGAVRCWRETGIARGSSGRLKARRAAVGAALGLRYLQGGGPGCSYPEERPSSVRRLYHSLVFWGFALRFRFDDAGLHLSGSFTFFRRTRWLVRR